MATDFKSDAEALEYLDGWTTACFFWVGSFTEDPWPIEPEYTYDTFPSSDEEHPWPWRMVYSPNLVVERDEEEGLMQVLFGLVHWLESKQIDARDLWLYGTEIDGVLEDPELRTLETQKRIEPMKYLARLCRVRAGWICSKELVTQNEDRDAWLYKLRKAGKSLPVIIEELNEHRENNVPDWGEITTAPGIRAAIDKHCLRNGLQLLRKKRNS